MSNKAIHGITVSHFYETWRDRLKLDLVTSGAGLHRLIREGSINRPSLALTGFFKYFANKRIQVLGAAEMTFFKTVDPRKQIGILNQMADRGVPCIVLTRNFHPTHAMVAVAEERRLPIFRTPMITMHWVNLATLCVDQEFAAVSTEHATTVDINGMGVMLRGESGTGKSECALALIERGALLVADDLTVVRVVEDSRLLASSRELNRGYMECRGIGIINIAEMFGIRAVRIDKHIDLVITLRDWTPDAIEERTGLEESTYRILEIDVPHVELYVRPGRDIARLVEVAAMVQALKKIGHDPAKEFNNRLIAYMSRQAEERERVIKPFTPPPPPRD
ncbi:MAG: HPr(Ser) kinase/phosphatase [Opitutaceae bacterium]|jgi:HPr kinase/phosphorylase|nr:HPr(Ser) kinase/phosphatase [Opitutaceae bacterium]